MQVSFAIGLNHAPVRGIFIASTASRISSNLDMPCQSPVAVAEKASGNSPKTQQQQRTAQRDQQMQQHAEEATARGLSIRPVLVISRHAFVAIWWAIQIFHVMSIIFGISVIRVCKYFIVNELSLIMGFLGEDAFWFLHIVEAACAVITVCHSMLLLYSVWCSLRARDWCFSRNPQLSTQIQVTSAPTLGNDDVQPFNNPLEDSTVVSWSTRASRAMQKLSNALATSFSLNGKFYDPTFFVLEVVEISFQTYQAYKLSTLVPRIWINHVYALVLVMNCWSTVCVHAYLPGNQFAKRLALITVDAIFDIITSTLIPAVILVPYFLQFDYAAKDFPFQNYYDDVWFVQAVSENRQVFVMSWLDFVSKLTPFVAMLGAVTVLTRSLVIANDVQRGPIAQLLGSNHSSSDMILNLAQRNWVPFSLRWIAVTPNDHTRTHPNSKHKLDRDDIGPDAPESHITWSQRREVQRISHGKYKSSWRDVVFLVAGAIILTIHIHASVVGVSFHTRTCLLEMRPWLSKRPSCATFEVNCAHGEMDQGADVEAVGEILSHINPHEVKIIVFASCSRLHVPQVIQTFSMLEMLKIYNSTVELWDKSAELRADLHQNLLFLYVSDTNFSSGVLPEGLTGAKFPPQLMDAEFSGTNLIGLPSDLHLKWKGTVLFVLERSPSITHFPETLTMMPITHLVIRDNRIESIPDELLKDQAYHMLLLDSNPLVKLPRTIGAMNNYFRVGISYTSFAALPQWATTAQMNSVTGQTLVPVFGTILLLGDDTMLCSNGTDRNGKVTAHLAPYFEVACSFVPPSFGYPIDYEREWRARSKASFA